MHVLDGMLLAFRTTGIISLMASAVVPAAGSASRFGGGKLFALVDGVPLLDRTLGALLDGGIAHIVVVTPAEPDWGGVVARLRDRRVSRAINPDPSPGMFSSIQIGLRAAAAGPIAILPGDMPFVSANTVRQLIETAERTRGLVSPRLHGRRGHPLLMPIDLRDAVLAAPPPAMLNDVLRPYASRVVNVDVDDPGVVRDVDVKADLG